MLKALVFLTVLYVYSYRWVHFSSAVLFCQPHQRLFTHSLNLIIIYLSVCHYALNLIIIYLSVCHYETGVLPTTKTQMFCVVLLKSKTRMFCVVLLKSMFFWTFRVSGSQPCNPIIVPSGKPGQQHIYTTPLLWQDLTCDWFPNNSGVRNQRQSSKCFGGCKDYNNLTWACRASIYVASTSLLHCFSSSKKMWVRSEIPLGLVQLSPNAHQPCNEWRKTAGRSVCNSQCWS